MADWPSYDLPAGVVSEGGTPPPQDAQSPSSEAPGAPSPDPSATSDAARPTGDTGQPPTPPSGAEPSIPQSRYDEVNTRYEQLMQQNQLLLGQLARMTDVMGRSAPPQPGEAPVQLDEREQRIVAQMDRLLQHTPVWRQLAPILGKMDVLMRLADEIPAQRQSETQHWQSVATRTIASVLDTAADTILGAGKKGKDLDRDRAATLTTSFRHYVEADPQRIARYEANDQSLVKDFVTWFRGWGAPGQPAALTPEARRLAALQQQRGEAVRRLPTAGANGQPVSSAPPKVNNLDEDAVHSAGWAAFQREVAASR